MVEEHLLSPWQWTVLFVQSHWVGHIADTGELSCVSVNTNMVTIDNDPTTDILDKLTKKTIRPLSRSKQFPIELATQSHHNFTFEIFLN